MRRRKGLQTPNLQALAMKAETALAVHVGRTPATIRVTGVGNLLSGSTLRCDADWSPKVAKGVLIRAVPMPDSRDVERDLKTVRVCGLYSSQRRWFEQSVETRWCHWNCGPHHSQ